MADDETKDKDLFEALMEHHDEETDAEGAEETTATSYVEVGETILNSTYEKLEFKGAFLDIGASKSVIGKHQAEANQLALGNASLVQLGSGKLFKLGDQRTRSIGKI